MKIMFVNDIGGKIDILELDENIINQIDTIYIHADTWINTKSRRAITLRDYILEQSEKSVDNEGGKLL